MADEKVLDDDVESLKLSQSAEKTDTTGRDIDGFADPSRSFPREDYVLDVTTNKAARGHFKNDLKLGGGYVNVSLELNDQPNSTYPLNQIRETVTGHVTEIDDTPGSERMLFKHRTGAGVEFRSDGSVVVCAKNNTVQITDGDHKVIVEGDGELIYNGNLKLSVSGDFDLDVKGNFNVRTGGNKVGVTNGSYKQIVERNHDVTVKKNMLSHVLGTTTHMSLGNYNHMVKGNQSNYVEGEAEFFVSDTLKMTAQNEVVLSAKSANITASSMTLMGDSGVIGGTGIIAYGKGATFEEGITAPTFHGDLDGTATTSTVTQSQNYAEGLTGTAGAITNTITPILQYDGQTIKPTTSMIDDLLDKSDLGYRRVQIDIGNVLRNKIDKTEQYGGVATRVLTTAEVRSKLRDPKNYSNTKFVGSQIAEGKLSPTYIEKTHPIIGRIIKNESTSFRGKTKLGSPPLGTVKRVKL